MIVPLFSYAYARQHVPFVYEETPSEVGAFSEHIRRKPQTVRSLHPLFSLGAVGPAAHTICDDTGRSAYGERSAFGRLRAAGTTFVCLGTTLPRSLTYVHHLEHLYGVNHYMHKAFDAPVYRGGQLVPGPWLAFVRTWAAASRSPWSASRSICAARAFCTPTAEKTATCRRSVAARCTRKVCAASTPIRASSSAGRSASASARRTCGFSTPRCRRSWWGTCREPARRLSRRPVANGPAALSPAAVFHLAGLRSSPGDDRAARTVADSRVPPGRPLGGWTIPPSWDYTTATVSRQGRCLYDAGPHPLRLIALSTAFAGSVSREVLRRHLHYDRRHPQWVPWHFRQLYRPWDRTWGFCVPQTFYDALEPGSYDVLIETQERAAPLKVADCTLPGRRRETVLLAAHLDHPHMANDDLAGVMVGLRVMQLLGQRPRRFTYRLVIVQEIVGSEYYLAQMAAEHELEHFFAGLFLEMLGSDTPLALQRAHGGNAVLEEALRRALGTADMPFREGPFRSIVGNDEINWESRGVPMTSLSRFPYPQYHSDQDDLSVISPQRLEESARVVLEALQRFDEAGWLEKCFAGCICASHPDYDLYVDAGQPAFDGTPPAQIANLRRLMDAIPIELARPKTVGQLAAAFDLPEAVAAAYLRRWQEKGLLRPL